MRYRSRRQRVNLLRLAHARDKLFHQRILFVCRNEIKCPTIIFHNTGYARGSRSQPMSHHIFNNAILYLLYLLWCDGNDLLQYTISRFILTCRLDVCVDVYFNFFTTSLTREMSSVDLRTLTDKTHNVASSRLGCLSKVRLIFNTSPRPVN